VAVCCMHVGMLCPRNTSRPLLFGKVIGRTRILIKSKKTYHVLFYVLLLLTKAYSSK